MEIDLINPTHLQIRVDEDEYINQQKRVIKDLEQLIAARVANYEAKIAKHHAELRKLRKELKKLHGKINTIEGQVQMFWLRRRDTKNGSNALNRKINTAQKRIERRKEKIRDEMIREVQLKYARQIRKGMSLKQIK